LLGLLLPFAAMAGDKPRLAVLVVSGISHGNKPILTDADSVFLTDELRSLARAVLGGSYRIVTPDEISDLLGPHLQDLDSMTADGGVVEIGRRLGVSLLVSGVVAWYGARLGLVLEVYDIGAGGELATTRTLYADDVEALASQLSIGAVELMKSLHDGIAVSFETTPPGADVTVDDDFRCSPTPCELVLPEGRHLVVLEHGWQWNRQEQEVSVSPLDSTFAWQLEPSPDFILLREREEDLAQDSADKATRERQAKYFREKVRVMPLRPVVMFGGGDFMVHTNAATTNFRRVLNVNSVFGPGMNDKWYGPWFLYWVLGSINYHSWGDYWDFSWVLDVDPKVPLDFALVGAYVGLATHVGWGMVLGGDDSVAMQSVWDSAGRVPPQNDMGATSWTAYAAATLGYQRALPGFFLEATVGYGVLWQKITYPAQQGGDDVSFSRTSRAFLLSCWLGL